MSNRHERRKAKAVDRWTSPTPTLRELGTPQGGEPKAKITFHTEPKSMAPEHMAIMLVAMTHAFSTGCKVPGVTFPIHISVQLGKDGTQACGTIEPSDETGQEEPLVRPQACAVH